MAKDISRILQSDIVLSKRRKINRLIDRNNTLGIEAGTTQGQLMYWNGSNWDYIGNTELFWDDSNNKLRLNNDIYIYHNGTNGFIETNINNPSDLFLNCGTEKTMELTEGVYEDLNVGGLALTKASSNQPTLTTLDGTNILSYAFQGTNNINELHGSFELSHSYKEGTDLHVHAHFYPTTNDVNDVKIYIDYYILIGETNSTVKSGTFSAVQTTPGSAWNNMLFSLGVIDGTGLKTGSQIHFRVYRDPTDAQDTYENDVVIGTFGIHYQKNTLGTRQIITK